MKKLVNDTQHLIVKHGRKLLAVFIVVFLIANFSKIKRGFIRGWNFDNNNTQAK